MGALSRRKKKQALSAAAADVEAKVKGVAAKVGAEDKMDWTRLARPSILMSRMQPGMLLCLLPSRMWLAVMGIIRVSIIRMMSPVLMLERPSPLSLLSSL